jgi:uncharacterized protein YdeI (YjbR/CyaY-like superfamily)
MTKSSAKSFEARLERDTSNLGWVVIRIPFDVSKIWGTRAQLKVKGEINGFRFRTSLFPTGGGKHVMLVNKRMQAGARASFGMTARFRLEPDTEERIVTIPAELEHALSEDRKLRRWFDKLNYSMRKWMADRVTHVKSVETRTRRADQIAELLLATMEAERELPPILEAAFAHDARAREGWKRMSPSQRRMHLFGIFYYQSPEARARRLAKTVQDAYKFADRGAKSRVSER